MPNCPDRSLFPMPLVPFEEYQYVDDRPSHPAAVFTRLRFSGHFDRAAIQAALTDTLPRHPLLQALVRPSRQGRLEWFLTDGLQPMLCWDRQAGPATLSGQSHIDLRHESGLRVFLRESETDTHMLLQIHHSCSDAIGHVCFVNDLLSTYYQKLSPSISSVARAMPDPERLRRRGNFGLSTVGWLARSPKDLLAALASIEYLCHRPVPVASPQSDAEASMGEGHYPTFAAHTLSESQTAGLREAARGYGGSVNDLLLTAVFFALHQWNLEHDRQSSRKVLRIMVPVNLRTPADTHMPAANVVSMVYLDRRPHRYASPHSLFKSVRWEMGICKRWRLGLTLIHFMRICRRLPGGLAPHLPVDRCLATAVMSNLGDITNSLPLPPPELAATAGAVVLDEFDFLPHVRPWTCAAFGAATYRGRTTLTVHCDRQRFSSQDARELLMTYVDQIATLVNR